jgi:predicted nucleotidyltransferase
MRSLDEIEQSIRSVLLSYGATSAAVFGSYAKGTATEASDIDLLVGLPDHLDLWDIIHIENELSDLLGIKVDLATEGALSPYIRAEVMKTLRPIPLSV